MAEPKTNSTGDMVTIRLPKTRDQQEDEYVGVNGRTWQIKRGVKVEVPACVAEVLQSKERMLETIMDFEDRYASK